VAPPASAGAASGRIALEALPTQGPCWYSDSWGHPRSGGRKHVGVDIFTVPGEYVYAVADGRLTLRKWAQPGNISGNAWRLTADNGTAYFYAHLSDFAPGLSTGSRVEAGQIIGWIGKTGNTTVDHLHFEIRPGGGSPVNPYPILQSQGGGCNRGTPYTQPGGWVPDS
jgi:murein DD-endopeptidase MepM/ murein hydrolase activator NlpD